MKRFYLVAALLSVGLISCEFLPAQQVPDRLVTGYAPLDKKLASLVTADANAISAQEAQQLSGAQYLDAREPDEYLVSHLPAARYIGYKSPDWSVLDGMDKNAPVVVYCTVGYRSERMADDLRERGFTDVRNLYGSIYAWRLAGGELLNAAGEPTDSLHTYDRKWGKLLPDGAAVKTY